MTGGGGAIYLEPHGKGTPKLAATLSKFNRNKALKGTGGAISAINGNIEIYDCEFKENEAAEGGAVGLKGKGKLVLHDGDFQNNKAANSGGAVAVHHGRSFYKKTADLNQDSIVTTTFLGESEFSGNTASLGGKDFAYARYYDADFLDDTSAPKIEYAAYYGHPAMSTPVHTDLTFSDIYRTVKK